MSLGDFRENFADVAGIRSDIAHAREQSREQHLRENEEKLGLASGSIESISRYAKHLERHNNEIRGRGGKKADNLTDFLLIIDGQRQALLDNIGDLENELDKVNQRIGEIDERLAEIEDMTEGINGAVEQADKDGKFALNDEGDALANERAEAALRDYEERTGRKIDRTEYDAVLAALQAQRKHLTEEAATLTDERQGLDEYRVELEGNIRTAKKSVNELDEAEGVAPTFAPEEIEMDATVEEAEAEMDALDGFFGDTAALASDFRNATSPTLASAAVDPAEPASPKINGTSDDLTIKPV